MQLELAPAARPVLRAGGVGFLFRGGVAKSPRVVYTRRWLAGVEGEDGKTATLPFSKIVSSMVDIKSDGR
jgi:hypothetical protein